MDFPSCYLLIFTDANCIYDKITNDTESGKDIEYVHVGWPKNMAKGCEIYNKGFFLIPRHPNGATIFIEIVGVEEVGADILRSRLPDGKI